jgi:hypothetical protein
MQSRALKETEKKIWYNNREALEEVLINGG